MTEADKTAACAAAGPSELKAQLDLPTKIAQNIWDHVDDFLRVWEKKKRGEWEWLRNSRCKYVELRIDMRDGGCILRDREGNRIDPSELEYQFRLPEESNAANEPSRNE